MPTKESPQRFPGGREDRTAQPQMVQRQANLAQVRSVHPANTLTPPLEEREQREAVPAKRGSWATFGGNVLGAKAKPKEFPGATTDSQPQTVVPNGAKNEGILGGKIRSTDGPVTKTSLVEQPVYGGMGRGRY